MQDQAHPFQGLGYRTGGANAYCWKPSGLSCSSASAASQDAELAWLTKGMQPLLDVDQAIACGS